MIYAYLGNVGLAKVQAKLPEDDFLMAAFRVFNLQAYILEQGATRQPPTCPVQGPRRRLEIYLHIFEK